MTDTVRSLPSGLVDALRAQLGTRLQLERHERHVYSYDATGVMSLPDAVVRPRDPEEVAFVMRRAVEWSVPVVMRGAGSGLSAGAVPEHGGIVLSSEEMAGVISIDVATRRIWVGPGVVNASLDAVLAPLELFYAPDPASHRVSTIGGNIAENAGGPRAVKYGVTGQHVTALRVVDVTGANGELRAGELQNGPDLASLMIGSEGTLAAIVAAELKLLPRPAYIATVLVPFERMSGATAFVSRIIEAGIVPATLEFIDRYTIDAIELWGVAHYPPGAGAVLLLELDGEREAVADGLERVRVIANEMGAMQVTSTDDPAERDGLWLGRRSAFAAVGRFARRAQTQDITVPRERLTAMLEAVEGIATRFGLLVATIGHAGDGNLHPDFLYNDGEEDIEARIHEANTEVFRACVAMGGSISGEHGIGSDKLHGMPIMFGPTELGIMADVKRAFDPTDILNPGKAVLPVQRLPAIRVSTDEQAAVVQERVLDALERGEVPKIDLSHCLGITVDPENLTVEVGAGASWDAVDAALEGSALHFPLAPLRERSIYRSLLLNDYGPEHLAFGTLRQHLLAVTFVTGRGEVVSMGRAVVKNVAGYDLFRLLIGSRGRYGIPIRCIFRLAPRSRNVWVRGAWRPDGEIAIPTGAEAAFAVWDGAAGHVYYRVAGVSPVGWEPAPDAERALVARRKDLLDADDILDLHLHPTAASGTQRMGLLADLSTPVIILPHAERFLVRAERDSAMRLVDEARTRGVALRRADWGRAWERLIPLDEPARRWDGLLTNAVFGGSMLGDCFEREMRAQ